MPFPPSLPSPSPSSPPPPSSSPMSFSSSPQQHSPVMKPDSMAHSPTGSHPHAHQRGLQGDLRDMISMYMPPGESTDPNGQRGYTNIPQHYLGGSVPLTHI